MPFKGPVVSGVTAGGAEVALRVSASGQLETTNASGTAGPQKFEDAVAVSGDAGVFTLGVRAPAAPAAQTSGAGDYGAFAIDSEGKTIVSGSFAAPEHTKQVRVDFTAVTDLQLFASAGAGLRTYITDLTVENTGAATARFLLRDGTTTVWSATVPAASTLCETWETPLRMSAATIVNGQLGAAGTVTVSASGYNGV